MGDPASPVVSPPDPTSSAVTPAATLLAGMFDVGGHSLYMECSGTGSPTVVYLHGIGGDRLNGAALLNQFSGRVRVCIYDRPNMGKSGHVEGVQTGAKAAKDLAALLTAAGIPPPYVLVAESFGGLIALIYAAAHPKDVAGMVFVDARLPSDADIDQALGRPWLLRPDQTDRPV